MALCQQLCLTMHWITANLSLLARSIKRKQGRLMVQTSWTSLNMVFAISLTKFTRLDRKLLNAVFNRVHFINTWLCWHKCLCITIDNAVMECFLRHNRGYYGMMNPPIRGMDSNLSCDNIQILCIPSWILKLNYLRKNYLNNFFQGLISFNI